MPDSAREMLRELPLLRRRSRVDGWRLVEIAALVLVAGYALFRAQEPAFADAL